MKYLVVNADDFGFTRDVNDGIVESHLRGILTSTTLMANGAQFDHAVALAKQHPTLDIGVHLVLCGGNALSTGAPLPATVSELIPAVVRRKLDYAAELELQVRRILDAGLKPTHLDTHKHTHLLPPVLNVVAKLSRQYGIRWVRRPFDLPLKQGTVPWSRRIVSRSLHFVRRRFHTVLSGHNCLTTDYFAGFQMTGYLQMRDLIETLRHLPEGTVPWSRRIVSRSLHFVRRRFHTVLSGHNCLTTDYFAGFQMTGYLQMRDIIETLRHLPEGSTEFMTHPAFCTEELRAAGTRLKESRQRELEALTDPKTRQAVEDLNIQLVDYPRLESLTRQNRAAGV